VLSRQHATAWLAGEDAEIIRWFEFPRPSRIQDVEKAIVAWRESWLSDGPVRQWGIWFEGQLAGGVELRDRGDRRVNLSYVVFPQFRRQGLAVEAIRQATTWALAHLPVDAVVAVIDVANEASRAVAVRCGFAAEGPAERWEYDESGPSLRYVFPAPEAATL
jgi:RimJ/RimL family protein N-acetyltransferase